MNDDKGSDDPLRRTAFNSADPPRNFTLSVNDRIRAMTIGAPAYATRKKHIEDLEAAHVRALVTLHDKLVARGRDAAAVQRAMHEQAHAVDLRKLNTLVETHNRYYPIEANLPTNLRTGDYDVHCQRWMPEAPWTASRLLGRALALVAAREED